jgi:DNA repair photolyase
VNVGARYHEVEAKSLLRRQAVVDPWFLGCFGSNLYRGCEHGCAYCDGRAERYHVAGTFDRDIAVKRNALALAEGELGRIREPGFLFIGGGVCDAYQPAEARYGLARGLLDLCRRRRVPVHVLTKSALVERDLELLAAINRETRAVLSFSIALVEERHRELFEPGSAPLAERWRLLDRARALGLGTGVMAMPLLPGISDSPAAIDAIVRRAKDAGVDFLCAAGLTLRPGVQRDGYLAVLAKEFPALLPGCHKLFARARASGTPDPRYLERLDGRIRAALAEHGVPGRMPRRLFAGRVPLYTEIGVLLEHRGYERSETGGHGGRLSRAGWALTDWARARLARQRGRDAFRLVEAELALLVRSDRLHEIPGLDCAVLPDVVEIASQVMGAGSMLRPSTGRSASHAQQPSKHP